MNVFFLNNIEARLDEFQGDVEAVMFQANFEVVFSLINFFLHESKYYLYKSWKIQFGT